MVVLVMFYLGGVKWWVNCSLIMLGLAAITVLLLFVYDETRLVRFISFQDPWADPQNTGWQLIQSYFALGQRWLVRHGDRHVEAETPVFALFLLGLYLRHRRRGAGLCGRHVDPDRLFPVGVLRHPVAMNAYDRFGCYLAAGITAMLGIQVIINILVVTGWMPTTGLPLPFFTAGGTTLMIFLCSMGLLLSVSRRQNPLVKKPKPPKKRGKSLRA